MTEIVWLPDVTRNTVDAALHGGVTSIGNFDGVHRGHASLLQQTRQLADELDGPAIACLFDPHPIALLRPDAAPKRLTTVDERARRMQPLGIDYLLVCQTTQDLLDLSPEAFFRALILGNLRSRGIVEGANFCFGKDRRGDVAMLRQQCRNHDIAFRAAQMRLAGGEMISSTRIRNELDRGRVEAAARMMGHPHRLSGQVTHGDQRGQTLGFPTANLDDIEVVIPAPGVYAAWADTGDGRYGAAVHLGPNPTFRSGGSSKVEVHLIDYSGDLYGQTLSVDFVDRIRDVARFESPEALTTQLTHDIRSVRQRLEQHQEHESL